MPAHSRAECAPHGVDSRGAAPWNEKIDCFSSPTAKMVRSIVRAAGARRRIHRSSAG